jgi:hypothetical protein
MPTPGELSENPPRRSRIVVNLEEPPQQRGRGRAPAPGSYAAGGRPKKSRLGRVLAIFAALVLIVVVGLVAGCYFWWQSYKGKPAYSLALLVDAVQRNDMKTFDSLVDTDKVVDNFVPQATNAAAGQLGSVLPQSILQQAQTLLPRMLPNAKQKVHDQVVAQAKELSARAQGKPFVLIAAGMPWVVNVAQQGDAAKASMTVNNRPITLFMQRKGDVWQVVGINDAQLTQKVVQSVAADAPLIGSQNNQNSNTRKPQKPAKPRIQLPQITLPGANQQ